MDYELLFNKHIGLVKAVNESKTQAEYNHAAAKLNGYRDCLDVLGINQLTDCDNFYLEQGVDRDMCCGVFLDWQPTE